MKNLQNRIDFFYKYIEDNKLRNKELVNLLGFTKGQVSNILTKKVNPSVNFLDTFEEKFNVTEQDLAKVEKNDTGNFSNLNTNLFKAVPFYNINVSAGDVVFLDDGFLENREPDDLMFIPKNIDADIAFPTYGHSMYPEISNGDRVAYKVIKDWSFFNYGMKYLIITAEQRMVKYLKKHEKEGYVLLESRNKDFEPIDMPISSIRAILQVRYIGKIEM
ncbi:XRE family transcriptional regulator [Paenimyroides tangerinum]|uniref:XRE family transcriptional regulator n=1 Tax=Paenimyroides tangerinum TaxID=2488728 RepID=A0A3P3WA22_9FLAO|nr:S24 family peptidase [Paenimyroides tangerinum]RRJ91564.1 XRE family transcriptional regulator [Paenimyroides tangerinum]